MEHSLCQINANMMVTLLMDASSVLNVKDNTIMAQLDIIAQLDALGGSIHSIKQNKKGLANKAPKSGGMKPC